MRTVRQISRALFFAGGIGLSLIAVTRFQVTSDEPVHDALLNFAYLLLSLFIGFTQYD